MNGKLKMYLPVWVRHEWRWDKPAWEKEGYLRVSFDNRGFERLSPGTRAYIRVCHPTFEDIDADAQAFYFTTMLTSANHTWWPLMEIVGLSTSPVPIHEWVEDPVEWDQAEQAEDVEPRMVRFELNPS